MAQAKFRGRFVWQELMTEDTAAASTFYSKLLGWHAHASGGDPAYTEMHAGSRGVAGLMKLPDSAKAMGAKPMWMPYITVDEVDPAVVELERLGGKVVRPAMDIPKVGRFAVVSDPQGGVFAVMKPMGSPPPPPAAPQVGEFSWMELATTDVEAAFSFYSKMFGWQALNRMDMGPMGVYLIFGADGMQSGGIFKLTAERGTQSNWLPYASVADTDVSVKAVASLGGHLMGEAMDVPDGGRIAHLKDPTGVMFAIHSQNKPKVATPPAKPAAPPPPPPPKPASPMPAAPPPPKPAAPPPPAQAAVVKPVRKPQPSPAPAPAPAAAKPRVAAPVKVAKKKAAAKKSAKRVMRVVKKPVNRVMARIKKAVKKVARKVARNVARKVAQPARKKGPAVKKGKKSRLKRTPRRAAASRKSGKAKRKK